jgi:DNA-binding NtrC family response regulator
MNEVVVLAIEPDEALRDDFVRILGRAGCSVDGAATKEQAEARLLWKRSGYDIVFLEPRLALRAGDGLLQIRAGLDILDLIEGSFPEMHVFIMTRAGDIGLAAAKAESYSVVSGIFVKPPAWEGIVRCLEALAPFR